MPQREMAAVNLKISLVTITKMELAADENGA